MSENGTYNILMIEDQEEVSSLVKSSLEVRGHTVSVIEDGKQALNHVEKVQPGDYDVILLDLNLPGANGWQILAKIRSLPNTSKVPVIMLTGVDDDSSESRALLDGADDYVVKPCTMKVLSARIEANVRKKTSQTTIDFDLPYSHGDFEELSDREKEILAFVVQGYTNKEIAEKAFISEMTVINHVRNIFVKLKVNNRLQAAVIALKFNLI